MLIDMGHKIDHAGLSSFLAASGAQATDQSMPFKPGDLGSFPYTLLHSSRQYLLLKGTKNTDSVDLIAIGLVCDEN